MSDIYDIKTFLFWFLTSVDVSVFLGAILFFVFFYILIVAFFTPEKQEISIDISHIDDDFIKKRFQYILDNASHLERSIFYREVNIFLRNLIQKDTLRNDIFTLTLDEIEKNIQTSHFEVLKNTYFLQFNPSQKDWLDVRKNLLEQIKI